MLHTLSHTYQSIYILHRSSYLAHTMTMCMLRSLCVCKTHMCLHTGALNACRRGCVLHTRPHTKHWQPHTSHMTHMPRAPIALAAAKHICFNINTTENRLSCARGGCCCSVLNYKHLPSLYPSVHLILLVMLMDASFCWLLLIAIANVLVVWVYLNRIFSAAANVPCVLNKRHHHRNDRVEKEAIGFDAKGRKRVQLRQPEQKVRRSCRARQKGIPRVSCCTRSE